jgi:hypothetical protein
MEKVCGRCKIPKPRESFKTNVRRSDGLQTDCIECRKEYNKAWYGKNKGVVKERSKRINRVLRKDNRRRLLQYLSEHPCVDCPETDPVVLEFDHLRDKKFQVSQMMNRSWRLIETEIAKCEVRCANCHRRRTARQFSWYKDQ